MVGCGGYRNQCVCRTQTCPTDWVGLVSGDQTRHDPGESLFLFREERGQRWTRARLCFLDAMLHRGGQKKHSGIVSVRPAVEMSLFVLKVFFF